jgi:hypothetical protein
MDAAQLAETTMDPRHRTLRRIRIEDAAPPRDMFSLLMGTEVPPRRDFIVGGAAELDPSRIDTRCRAPTTALACCWRSMAWAISGAYDSRVSRDSMMCTPAAATRVGDLGRQLWVISSALSRSDSAPLPRLS